MPTIPGTTQPFGFCVVPGGPNAAPLSPCGGIDTADTIVTAYHVSDDLVTKADVTAEATIPAADQVQLAVTDTSGDFVLVVWQEDE